VVHHIAAGEVIDSLGAVVRELVENAIDAQASAITISLWPALGRVQVADNGIGMTYENLRQAAIPHSTSKIRHQADLWQVSSLGFRGEALHSLAQVAQLELCSRPHQTTAGWQVRYSPQGEVLDEITVAIAPGTIATVSQLFANWPARRQRLPGTAQQLRQVQRVIHHLALGHPPLTWMAYLNDRPWFNLSPGATARALIPQMLKGVNESDLREGRQPIPWDDGPPSPSADRLSKPASLYGVIGLPDRCHRPRPDWVKVAVNGRLVTLPEIEQAILQAFRHTLPRHRYPLCFLHLTLPPGHIDWNRNPDKSAIYLHRLDHWIAHSQDCIDALLRQNAAHLSDRTHHQRLTQLLKASEPGGDYRPSVNLSDPLPSEGHPAALKAIAQVHNRYILAEHPDGICLIEQHIAHERVLYERLRADWQLVPLATPVVLEQLSTAQIQQLQRLGLMVEPFGNQLWAVRQAPAPLADREDLPDALLELSLGGNLDAAQVAIACRTAIRNGTPLSLEAMQHLLHDWQQTRAPRTCPHGRPICLTLEESSLARFFRRHWVIGKSHGV
jgi:DNA mismatch repair protein MutL